ncbi:unnamed protein product [Rotaria magnacalcarata]|uniref:Uncharacterized protein n=1 Tax=Rotaria magnacalcarata TaxID=392030 RepID=A0A8S3FFN4_9BILA|nr:unnamed protein product [Rotaria magnacalcarata]
MLNTMPVIKFRFPEKILTNTITTAFGEIAYGQYECSLFDWHVIDDIKTTNNHTQWTHVHCGSFYIFHGEHVNKFVHLVCVPRNNSLREGIQAESITKTSIIPCPLDLPIDSNKYHADIISLQVCDISFYEQELLLVLQQYGYLGDMKIKSYSMSL